MSALDPSTTPVPGDNNAPAMVRHINLLTFKEGTEPSAIDALSAHLLTYADEIAEVRDVSFGRDIGLAQNDADFCIIVDFDDDAAFFRYLAHPAHARMVGEFLKPILAARHAIQFHCLAAGRNL